MTQLEAWIGTGPPNKRRWREGDIVIDAAGAMWRCTVSGHPGTWESVGGVSGASSTAPKVQSTITVQSHPLGTMRTTHIVTVDELQNSLLTIMFGPLTFGAGKYVSLGLQGIDMPVGATLHIEENDATIHVSNTDGTEKLALYSLGPDDIDITAGVVNVAFDPTAIAEQVGADLSVDGAGRIKSTAGGQFHVFVNCRVHYTPAP